MQKPPGVGKPACESRARFAAFGPTRSASEAAGSERERMNDAEFIYCCTFVVSIRRARNSLRLKGGGSGWGLRPHRLRCVEAADPHRLASLATSPFQGEEKSFHVI